MQERAVVVGAGINGLVAANYLQRNGFAVTLLERRSQVGGACAFDSYYLDGQRYDYPSGATVLGFMQDFVFEETGLSKQLSVCAPKHPSVVWFESKKEPCFIYDDGAELRVEVKKKWGENGDVLGYLSDFEKVRDFIINGYRNAEVPTFQSAVESLGETTASRWISGSARALMDHYFTSELMKVYCSIDVMESGPVSIDSPYSAFTIPLMSSGSIFGGKWGFVKGGLWKLTEELAEINRALGIEVITSARVLDASGGDLVTFDQNGVVKTMPYDYLIFATDPLSAAKLVKDERLIDKTQTMKAQGTSGKLVMLFRKPVIWKDSTGQEDFDLSFKFVLAVDTMDELESSTQAVVDGESDFQPGYFELYCEGAGMRKLGLDRGYESVSVFLKNLSFSKSGEQLPHVKQLVQTRILSRIENAEDLIDSILLAPKDLKERFFLPQGNIDHVELAGGQTYFQRNYSPNPESNFYQFGKSENVRYCAAGSYPCGSIAGTPGYMSAAQLIRARARAGKG